MKDNIIKWFKNTVSKEFFLIEMVFFIGIFIIIFTNFLVNLVFGLYFLGVILIGYSIFAFKFSGKGGENS
jgi:hypothetical protein